MRDIANTPNSGPLVVASGPVVTDRVRVEVVTGRGRVDGAVVVVGTGSVPTPATGGTLNKFKASSTLMG